MRQRGSPRWLQSSWLLAALVAMAAFILFAATMPRVITFEDAGLFDSVCATNGIAHPPGYPLFTLICVPLFHMADIHLFGFHLAVEPAILGNGISAVFAALACGMLVVILRLLGCYRSVAVFGGALLAVTASFWSQAIIVEVYALNAFIFLSTLYLCIRFYQAPDRWLAWGVCLVYSLGIANHWPLMVLAFPGLALICLARSGWIREQVTDARFVAVALVMVVLGLSPYATLLMKHHPLVSYSGPIHGLGALWDYFMRKSYAAVDHQTGANITDKLGYALWITRQMATQATPWALPLLLPALIAGHKRIGVPVQAGLALVFVLNTYGLVALLGFRYEYIYTAIFSPYPILAWCCLAIWFALGMQWLAERIGPVTTIAPVLIGVFGVTSILLTYLDNAPVNNRARSMLADRYSRLVLQTLAPNAALVVSADSQSFTLAYQHIVKGIRPDVTLYHINNLVFPGRLHGHTLKQRTAAVVAMAKLRPVYAIGVDGLPKGTRYGLYTRLGVPGDPPAARDNRVAAFRHRLIDHYIAGKFTQPQELYFASQRLLEFSNQLLTLGHIKPLTAAESQDLAALQKTFAGTLATLYFALVHPDSNVSGQHLLDRAFAADGSIPAEVGSEDRSLFHYYFALLFLDGHRGIRIDKALARKLLLKSFAEWPTPKTPGLCLLENLGPPKGHLATTARFRDACPLAD